MAMLMSCYCSAGDDVARAAEQPPTMAFLEFLAELQQVDGEWVTPLDVESQLSGDEADSVTATPQTEAQQPVAAEVTEEDKK